MSGSNDLEDVNPSRPNGVNAEAGDVLTTPLLPGVDSGGLTV